MNSPQAIAYLYSLQTRGMKFGLRGIRILLKHLGNPETQFPSIHVAGSNGKGSTAALLAASLTAAGYRTGLYTSPHLVSFHERIRIDGKPILERQIPEYVRLLRPIIEELRTTFFEAVTALAFRYFADEKVDIAVVETGLGGRLDATNVLNPVVSVLTTVSLEHTQILGNSLAAIAYEKAGIIKRGIPCVSGVTAHPAREVIHRTCHSRRSRLIETAGGRAEVGRSDLTGSTASFVLGKKGLRDVKIGLAGAFQVSNAFVALATLWELGHRGFNVTEADIRRGFARVTALTGFRGRLTVARRRPLTIVDVAHNPAAVRQLVQAIHDARLENLTIVFGVMGDKAFRSMIGILADIAGRAIAVQPLTERARSAETIAAAFRARKVPVAVGPTVREGMMIAGRAAGKRGIVLVTGSHFVVGEALAFMERKNYLTINQ
ncbi:MAG: bifunctional folylpolyglutamate synthase/dihydrofolate synthase [Ignavibacteriales bacterium]|nr:bifunctional folylpolyglutamate synthase/dihydrofolate synthase [Ignavibacteriales bacterium]